MEVSLSPETIFHLGSFVISNSILTAWIITLTMLIGGFLLRRKLAKIPSRFQAALEATYSGLLGMAESIIGHKEATRELFPYLITLFFYILISNWSGLLPGFGAIGIKEFKEGKEILVPLFRAPTSDLNTVASLAIFSVGFVQYLGLKYAGPKIYLSKFFNFRSFIGFFIGLIELISEFTRIISFSFRLFGNVFAGEVLISVMFYLTITLLPYVAVIPLPFFILETMVGLIQAFVFCFLTIVFSAMAVASHHEGSSHASDTSTLSPDVPGTGSPVKLSNKQAYQP